MVFTHSATLTRVCHFGSSSKSCRRSVEHTSASLRLFQKTSEQEEALRMAAKQLIAKTSASELLITLRASGIIECRRFSSTSGSGNTDKLASAGIGSG